MDAVTRGGFVASAAEYMSAA